MVNRAKTFFRSLLFVWLSLGPLAGWAATNLIVDQAWGSDETGLLALADVNKKLELQRFSGILMQGYGEDTLWVRLTIDAKASGLKPDTQLFLRIRPTFLDRIVVYDPLQPGEPQVLGDLATPSPAVAIRSPALVAPVAAGSEPRDIWVQIQSTSTRFASFELLTAAELQTADTQLLLTAAGTLGVLSFVLVWSVMMMLPRPSWLLLAFAFTQLMALVFSFWLLGLAQFLLSDLLSPAWINLTMSLSSSFYVLGINLFMYLLLRELVLPRWSHIWFAAVIAPIALGWILLATGNTPAALQINPVQALVAMVSFTVLAHWGKKRKVNADDPLPRLPKWSLVAYNWAVMLTFAIYVPAVSGVIITSQWTMFVPVFYSLINGLMMLAVLQYRNLHIQHAEQHMRTQAAVAINQAQQEKQFRQDKDELLSMLGHELKTPLATMQILLSVHDDVPPELSAGIRKSLRAMRELLERSIQSNHVEEGSVKLTIASVDLLALLDNAIAESAQPRRVVWRFEGDPIELNTDAILLNIVVSNLIDNALKYSPPASPVQVSLSRSDDGHEWTLEVSNEPGAAGFPDSRRVFEKYYRSSGARHQSGSGLGLYLCKGLTRVLGYRLAYIPDAHRVVFQFTLKVDPV